MFRLILFLFLLAAAPPAFAERFAVARTPAPVFNTADIGSIFGGKEGRLRTDRCGQIRELEFVALPGTLFTVQGEERKNGRTVLQVTSADYSYPRTGSYFVDARFVQEVRQGVDRTRHLPPRQEVIRRIEEMAGARYVWGGNVREGVPELAAWYPPGRKLDPEEEGRWRLEGVDCSGLLYAATGGWTPRNTSSLVRYGRPVAVAALSAREIAAKAEPLDLIVWDGHVMIVLDGGKVAESRLDCNGGKSGVIVRPLLPALQEIMRTRRPADSWDGIPPEGKGRFVLRRWYPPATPEASRTPLSDR